MALSGPKVPLSPKHCVRKSSSRSKAAAPSFDMPATIHLGSGHYVLDQEDERIRFISKHLPYYTGIFSPHDVPAFYDVTGITESPEAFQSVISILVERYRQQDTSGPTHIAGFDARGFIFGPPLALALGIPFVLIRKAGKLPGVLASAQYQTEYSEDETVMRLDSVTKGDRVVLVDDIIATGGTALAGFDLVTALGASVHEFTAIIDLPHLEGVKRIHSYLDGKHAVRQQLFSRNIAINFAMHFCDVCAACVAGSALFHCA